MLVPMTILKSISIPSNCGEKVEFAARELRRYFFLKSGRVLPIDHAAPAVGSIALMLPGQLDEEAHRRFFDRVVNRDVTNDCFQICLTDGDARITGASEQGLLFGVYKWIEKTGVRFYLHGDVVPREGNWMVEPFDVFGEPQFEKRGILPFHDFPVGPDWWQEQDYDLFHGQLVKMGMNFIGFHDYPARHSSGIEPAIWLGRPENVSEAGEVSTAYHATHFHTMKGSWGYQPRLTSQFHGGAGALFVHDDYGASYMTEVPPSSKSEEDNISRFNSTARFLTRVLGQARDLGIHVAYGTEAPVTLPETLKAELREGGFDPTDPEARESVLRGMLKRLARTFLPDTLWLWSRECWTWNAPHPEEVDTFVADVDRIHQPVKGEGIPMQVGTAGWVLGPSFDRAYFDKQLDSDVVLSAISRDFGAVPLDAGYLESKPERETWAIGWMESDTAMMQIQLNAARMQRDALKAKKVNANGLVALHWRTGIMAPTVAALAQACWQLPVDKGSDKEVRTEGYRGGMIRHHPGTGIVSRYTSRLYLNSLFDADSFKVDVPTGTYRVSLFFASDDHTISKAGQRIFNVSVQGQEVIRNMDVVAEAGLGAELIKTFEGIQVFDQGLEVDLVPVLGSTDIYAVEVASEADGYVRRINFGAEDVVDSFENDFQSMEYQEQPDMAGFFEDWCRFEFGASVAADAAAVFEQIDGNVPMVSKWETGPGGLMADVRPWNVVAEELVFVEEFCALESKITDPAAKERYRYWKNQLEALREMARFRCQRHQVEALVEQLEQAPQEQDLLPQEADRLRCEYRKLVQLGDQIELHLMQALKNVSDLATVAHLELQLFAHVFGRLDRRVQKLLSVVHLPADLCLSQSYRGRRQIILLSTPLSHDFNQPFCLDAAVPGDCRPERVELHIRFLGRDESCVIAPQEQVRGVYRFRVEPDQLEEDFIYYVAAYWEDHQLTVPADSAQPLSCVRGLF